MSQLIHDQTIDTYRIESIIAAGGMGEVYKVYNTQLDRFEAMKVLKPELANNPMFVTRFVEEAKRAAQLEHPHIIPIYRTSDTTSDYTYFTMKLIEGKTLNQLLKDRPFNEELALEITSQVARALEYAHQRGVVHRDIKAANIMIDQFNHVYLLDFGIAKALTQTQLTQTGTQMGTAAYMSPEQAQDAKNVDSRSDLYSLGVVMYEMLTCRVPFEGDSQIGVALQHIQKPPPDPKELNPSLSTTIQQVILKLLSKDPSDRFQTARELLMAIQRDTGSLEPPPAPKHPKARPSLTQISNPAQIAIIAILVCIFLAGVLVIFLENARHAREEKQRLELAVRQAEENAKKVEAEKQQIAMLVQQAESEKQQILAEKKATEERLKAEKQRAVPVCYNLSGNVEGTWNGSTENFPMSMHLCETAPGQSQVSGKVTIHWDTGAVNSNVAGSFDSQNLELYEARKAGYGFFKGSTYESVGYKGVYHYYNGKYPDYTWSISK